MGEVLVASAPPAPGSCWGATQVVSTATAGRTLVKVVVSESCHGEIACDDSDDESCTDGQEHPAASTPDMVAAGSNTLSMNSCGWVHRANLVFVLQVIGFLVTPSPVVHVGQPYSKAGVSRLGAGTPSGSTSR
ncbi:hypothetical protein FNH05_26040 [Amycolatopsis rhizosphaerae]|uniref:Uncharacterized protein n=1 Tax=Amycolatopsis rhizosphaerae TaxID=2053003 RepID=A0A558BGH8_9PSEU|nr:hypothetical protein [Amycolatopsis rhizosphaerae]TVT35608.1 hypothetical protein FNH05_26040 [Amycolatopsis rhizosphaerae]